MPNLAARIRQRLGPVWGAALLLFVAQRFGDAVNAFIGIWLVPRYIPQKELGAVLPLAQVAMLVAMPLSITLVRTITAFSKSCFKGFSAPSVRCAK